MDFYEVDFQGKNECRFFCNQCESCKTSGYQETQLKNTCNTACSNCMQCKPAFRGTSSTGRAIPRDFLMNSTRVSPARPYNNPNDSKCITKENCKFCQCSGSSEDEKTLCARCAFKQLHTNKTPMSASVYQRCFLYPFVRYGE